MTWNPVTKHISTPFAENVSPDNALPEHPRPQMVRQQWQNLNGLWDYALEPIGTTSAPATYQGQILVPFAIDAPLSGIMEILRPNQRLWYRRNFTVPENWAGKRILLHFQASDWETSVYINGEKAGQHRGGYDPFTFDITDHLTDGANELIVSCWDATEQQPQALGKQIMPESRQGFRYQPTGGIWQTVWLEAVPEQSIRTLRLTPDIDNATIDILVSGERLENRQIQTIAYDGNQQIAEATGQANRTISLGIPNAKLWHPDHPFLYDLKVKVQHNGETTDTIDSYFGMRKISIGEDENGIKRFLLNDKPIFQLGPLDQGYWPDGILTPPSDEAILFDLQYLKQIACNMVRVHVKTHPDRWYYHCDRLGLLVWQDMICMPKFGQNVPPEAAQQWKTEFDNIMDWLHNHPSVVQWIIFNEGWGQHDTERLTDLIAQRDPSRLVTSASGWTDMGTGDIYDIHDYTFYPAIARQQCANGRIVLLGEAGGFNLCIPGHTWYDHELNGWLTYDRKISKIDPDELGNIHATLWDPPQFETTIGPHTEWRYSTGDGFTQPMPQDTSPRANLPNCGGDWCQTAFDDSSWNAGKNPFGTSGTPIYLRTTINLNQRPDKPLFYVTSSADCQIFINGQLIRSLRVRQHSAPISETCALLHPDESDLLTPGKNTICAILLPSQTPSYLSVQLLNMT